MIGSTTLQKAISMTSGGEGQAFPEFCRNQGPDEDHPCAGPQCRADTACARFIDQRELSDDRPSRCNQFLVSRGCHLGLAQERAFFAVHFASSSSCFFFGSFKCSWQRNLNRGPFERFLQPG